MEVSELKLSLDLGERDRGEVQREKEEDVMEPETHWNRWKRENLPPLNAFSVLFITVKSEYIIKFEI
jgi:hypothetical protein